MRWYASIGAVLAAGVLTASDVAGVAAPDPHHRPAMQAADKAAAQVDVELILAVDVSYSMDMDELAVQREGYAQALISKEFLQALKALPNGKVAVTYFEWAASNDQKIIIPWRVIDGPETAAPGDIAGAGVGADALPIASGDLPSEHGVAGLGEDDA